MGRGHHRRDRGGGCAAGRRDQRTCEGCVAAVHSAGDPRLLGRLEVASDRPDGRGLVAARSGTQDGRGMVTAELAVATLAALAMLTMMCWGVYLVVIQLRCTDTAAAVARQAARGDKAAASWAEAAAPHGAKVVVERRPNLVAVTVRVEAKPIAGWLVAVPLEARAEVVP